MRKIYLIVVLIAIATGLLIRCTIIEAKKPAETARPQPITNLLFSDEFSGTSIDKKKWNQCYKWINDWNDCSNAGNSELELYRSANNTVANGVFKMTAKKETTISGGQTYPYSSGMVTTQDKFNFTYGYFESRMKVPTGKGLWSTFWTLPADHTWPPEIDALEILGNDPTTAHMTVHYYNDQNQFAYDMQDFVSTDFSKDFHTFAVDWKPNYIRWYIDGVLRREYTNTAYIPNKPMFLIANLAVGGNYPGAPDATTTFPASLDVDYIRVYNQKP